MQWARLEAEYKDHVDAESVKNHIRQLYEAGFSVEDARICVSVSEEVNPHISEDKALAVMNRLWAKYKR